jgi:hypothetical protein
MLIPKSCARGAIIGISRNAFAEPELIKKFITKKVAVFLIDRTEILDIDEKNLERFFLCDPAVHFCEETVPVIQFCQAMHTLALSLECQEQNGFHQNHQKTVQHNLRVCTLNDNTQGNDGK